MKEEDETKIIKCKDLLGALSIVDPQGDKKLWIRLARRLGFSEREIWKTNIHYGKNTFVDWL